MDTATNQLIYPAGHDMWLKSPDFRSNDGRYTVGPVFGHIAGMKKLNRFTLRGTEKVRTQWLLYCIVHNIGKIQQYSA